MPVSLPYLVVGISGATCGGKSSLARRLQAAHPSSVLIQQDDYFLPEDDPRHVSAPGLPHHNNWDCPGALDMAKLVQDVMEILHSDNNETKVAGRYSTCRTERLPGDVKASGLKSVLGNDAKRECDTCNQSELVTDGIDNRESNDRCKVQPSSTESPPNTPERAQWRLLILEGFLVQSVRRLREVCHVLWCVTLSRPVCWQRRQTRHYDPPDVPGYFDACVWPEYEAALERLKLEDVEGRVVYVNGEQSLDDMFVRLEGDVAEAARRLMEKHQ